MFQKESNVQECPWVTVINCTPTGYTGSVKSLILTPFLEFVRITYHRMWGIAYIGRVDCFNQYCCNAVFNCLLGAVLTKTYSFVD